MRSLTLLCPSHNIWHHRTTPYIIPLPQGTPEWGKPSEEAPPVQEDPPHVQENHPVDLGPEAPLAVEGPVDPPVATGDPGIPPGDPLDPPVAAGDPGTPPQGDESIVPSENDELAIPVNAREVPPVVGDPPGPGPEAPLAIEAPVNLPATARIQDNYPAVPLGNARPAAPVEAREAPPVAGGPPNPAWVRGRALREKKDRTPIRYRD